MTIGIAVYGPRAGAAAFQALAAVEKVGRGAIGGFVSFVVITREGEVLRAQTQRGGTRTLFTVGELTGAPPPPRFAEATMAGLMSSGPDRPDPLSQFTPARAGVGLVTGHRLPNMPGVDGMPLNEAVLTRMASGQAVEGAVRAELARNPGADAGVIALAPDGTMAADNTRLVAGRADLGGAAVSAGGASVAVQHNAIHPHAGLAALAAAAALDVIDPLDRSDFEVVLQAGLSLALGEAHRIDVDESGRIVAVTVPRDWWLHDRREGSVLGFAAEVWRGGALIGHAASEPYCVVEDGRLVSMSGAPAVGIGVRTLSSSVSRPRDLTAQPA